MCTIVIIEFGYTIAFMAIVAFGTYWIGTLINYLKDLYYNYQNKKLIKLINEKNNNNSKSITTDKL